MSVNLLNGAGFNKLQGAVNAAEMRQRVIANNVANADTPRFKRSEVLFEELLEESMGNGKPTIGRCSNEPAPYCNWAISVASRSECGDR